MPEIEVNILTNQKTIDFLLEEKSPLTHDKFTKLLGVKIPNYYNQPESSRYLKTNLRALLEGEFIFIDCDTIICKDFSAIVLNHSVGMVLDHHRLLSEKSDSGRKTKKEGALRGLDISKVDRYYNTGVMLVKDDENARVLFQKWFEVWDATRIYRTHEDQYSINAVNAEYNIISEIDMNWNFMVNSAANIFPEITKANIIHYLGHHSSINMDVHDGQKYLLNDPDILRLGIGDEAIQNIINYPHTAFRPSNIFLSSSSIGHVMKSEQFRFLVWIYKKNYILFRVLGIIPSLMIFFKRKLL